MPIRDLKAQIARLPEQPGVYLYSNGAGETLYVGKARVLRDRVRSYLGAYGTSPRIDALLDEAQQLEVIVTDSVVEALALENHLIKQRSPKYNILLRDDKNYPYLQLTTGEAYPRVLVARRVERDEHYYAGPFLPASLARKTMSLTHRLFGIRSCNETITGERGRPCLEYDIKRCIAPCVHELCTAEEYRVAVEHTKLFLEGRSDELLTGLRARMTEAALAERFEQAAQLRDAIKTIETLRMRQQKMASAELGDRDAFGLKLGPAGAVVQVFQVRGGRVVERVELVTEAQGAEGRAGTRMQPDLTDSEILQAALQQFYQDRPAPPEIHLPVAFSEGDADMIEGWLTAQAGRRVHLVVPKRGEKRGLLDLATRNAEVAYQTRFNENVAAHYDALETLRVVFALPSVPRRIECFDISTIQGSETVASMVVCEDGRMKKSEYRKFKIRGAVSGARRSAFGAQGMPAEDPAPSLPMAMADDCGQSVDTPAPAAAASGESASRAAAASGESLQPRRAQEREAQGVGVGPRATEIGAPLALRNDFASMHEVVLRRYRKLLETGGPFPDLILIDGGKGQLSAAYAALEELGLGSLVAAGIAKKEELLFARDREDAIALPPESPALLLIRRIRDEAHRFAVTFHRHSRTKRDLRSEVDVIAGVGPRRRKALLTAFGSLAGVRRATREELVRVVGAKCADAVLAHFASHA
ncbi:MAG TPA: excinuclease ABC subunit UvrC [Vicinamibacterales bacterium]|nr:excinuclease ABC subunit UvrC [Vicinamibacterales bacterium]